jgi:hypothetical protein
LISFSAKFLFVGNFDGSGSIMYNLDHFDSIEITSDAIILSMVSTSSSSYSSTNNGIEISTSSPLEDKKLEKLNQMVSNGYIVKANTNNKYFGTNSSRNLTVKSVKNVKSQVFTNAIVEFMNSNDNILNLNNLMVDFANEIPVEIN